jgi:epoxide hydrolase-like predicted phosphatase
VNIRAVIFDFGGVLVRTEDQAFRRALAARLDMTSEELGALIFESNSARQATLGEITTQEHWDFVRKILKLSEEEFPSVPLAFWGGDILDTALMDYIRSLHPQYKTALLSNAWDDLRGKLRQTWKIDDAFDEIIISSEVGFAKPDLRIYRLTLDRLRVNPDEAVFIDDFQENVDGSILAGLQAIRFESSHQVLKALSRLLMS